MKELTIKDIQKKLSVSDYWIRQHLHDVESRLIKVEDNDGSSRNLKKTFEKQSLFEKLFELTEFYATVKYIDLIEYSSNPDLTRKYYFEIQNEEDFSKKAELKMRLHATLNYKGSELVMHTAEAFYKNTQRKKAVQITDPADRKALFKMTIEKAFDEDSKLNTIKDMANMLGVNNDEMVHRKIYAEDYITIKIQGRTYFAACPNFFEEQKSKCELPFVAYAGLLGI